MEYSGGFSENMKMSALIDADPSMLWVISRFGLHLGFGERTIKEVCDENKIHCPTFLAVMGFLTAGSDDYSGAVPLVSIDTVVRYLSNAHAYFLDFKLPQIRNKLIDALTAIEGASTYVLLFTRFFDEYVKEVRRHMEYENLVVFPYVLNLLQGVVDDRYSIGVFEKNHNEIDSRLEELKKILVKYFPDNGNSYLLTEVLFDILSCETDIKNHNRVEDYLFIPAVEAVEHSMLSK